MPRISRIKKENVLVLDADSSIYAVSFMTEKTTHFGFVDGNLAFEDKDKRKYNKWAKEQTGEVTYDFQLEVEPVSYALHSLKKFVANTLEFTGCHRAIILLTKGGNCFRTHLATIKRYKGNRLASKKPVHYDAARKYYMDYYDASMFEKWEADDAACMIMHKGSCKPHVTYVMAAIDKDLYQMPCLHVNPSKAHKGEGVYPITESEGWWNFYHQMLCGDDADNINGLKGTVKRPGISKAGATKILAGMTDVSLMCQTVYDLYVIRYGSEPFAYEPWWVNPEFNPEGLYPERPRVLQGTALSMFRENANLLYMLRTPTDQYLPQCKQLIDLWTPYANGIVDEVLPYKPIQAMDINDDEKQSEKSSSTTGQGRQSTAEKRTSKRISRAFKSGAS